MTFSAFLLAVALFATTSCQRLDTPSILLHHHQHQAAIPAVLPPAAAFGIPTGLGPSEEFLPDLLAVHPAGLFTPNTLQQPAETPGQLENYRKALEEEAKERENNQLGSGLGPSRSYVSVEVEGAGKYNYGYNL